LSSGVAITPPARDVKLFPFLLNEFSLSLSLSLSLFLFLSHPPIDEMANSWNVHQRDAAEPEVAITGRQFLRRNLINFQLSLSR
jgi:hypothetical protein